MSISVARDGRALDIASVPTDEHGHRRLVDVDATVDPDIVSAPPASWWVNWLDRLSDVVRRLGFEFTPGQQIIAVDEASGARRLVA